MGLTSNEPPKYSRLIELASSVTEPLQIDAISYASPGWIQMIGDWNPIKVLAEFISKWRAENTKREANRFKQQFPVSQKVVKQRGVGQGSYCV
jgi:hypothetical protein